MHRRDIQQGGAEWSPRNVKGAARARSRGEKSCQKSSAGKVFAKLKKVERGYLLNIIHKNFGMFI